MVVFNQPNRMPSSLQEGPSLSNGTPSEMVSVSAGKEVGDD